MTPAMIRIIPVVETIRIQIIPAAETIQETTIPVQEILAMIRLEAEMNPAEMTLGGDAGGGDGGAGADDLSDGE